MAEIDMSDDHELFSDDSEAEDNHQGETNVETADLPSTSKKARVNTKCETTTVPIAVIFSSSSSSSEEEEDSDFFELKNQANIVWKKLSGTYLKNFNFSEISGLNAAMSTALLGKKEIDFFKQFIDDAIIDHLVAETNKYANQRFISGIIEESITPHSRLNKWVPTDSVEMHIFLGILLWMTLDKKPCFSDYWSRSILYNSGASQYMSRNRCELLLRMWHFSDNETCAGGDKLHKIKVLINSLVAKYKLCTIPGEELYLDEIIIPFRGRSCLGHKFGIKLFKLCVKGGYTYDAKIFCEKKSVGKAVPNWVVLDLMNSLLYKGRTLYTDYWCTSVTLARELLNRSTHLVGILRHNRKHNPREIIATELKKGEIIGQESSDGIVIMKCNDKREILILSTKHTDTMVKVNARDSSRTRPTAIVDYEAAVVNATQKTTSCSLSVRRSVKWYRKIALEVILGTTVNNALYLYNIVNNKNLTITKFKENLCLQLLQYCMGQKVIIQSFPSDVEKHKLKVCIENDKIIRQRCKSCYAKFAKEKGRIFASNNAKRVKHICPACPNNPHMCNNCFFEIHRAAAQI